MALLRCRNDIGRAQGRVAADRSAAALNHFQDDARKRRLVRARLAGLWR